MNSCITIKWIHLFCTAKINEFNYFALQKIYEFIVEMNSYVKWFHTFYKNVIKIFLQNWTIDHNIHYHSTLVCPCSSNFFRKKLQNPTHRGIIFCYVSWIFAYFILTHVDLYFIFSHRFLVIIVLHHTHEDAHLIRHIFVSCHWLFLLFVVTHKRIILFQFCPGKNCAFILPHLPYVYFVLTHGRWNCILSSVTAYYLYFIFSHTNKN